MVCVCLSSNLAALRALAIEGIQKAHMNLHSKNIAASMGVPSALIKDVCEYMNARKKVCGF